MRNCKVDMKRDAQFYMANLGSEVCQALGHYARRESEYMAQAIERAEAILLTITALPGMRARSAELEILRTLFREMENRTLAV